MYAVKENLLFTKFFHSAIVYHFIARECLYADVPFPLVDNGNGIFCIFGFLYLIPLNFLYEKSVAHITQVVCTSWIYTLLLFTISVQISVFIGTQPFTLSVLAIQTILYVCTFFSFKKLIQNKFMLILKNNTKKLNKLLLLSSICWFLPF